MSARRAIVMSGASPIPAGRRAEVLVLAKDAGAFSRAVQPQASEPLVHDLTTGVWYGRTWHLASAGPGPLEPRGPEPAADVLIAERFTAVVATCVVATYGQTSEQCVVTTLHLDVDRAPRARRPPKLGRGRAARRPTTSRAAISPMRRFEMREGGSSKSSSPSASEPFAPATEACAG